MAGWERYYEETNIRGFNEQAFFYLFVLEKLGSFIRQGVRPNEALTAILGGIHPLATKPAHFINLCAAAFPGQALNPVIIDQNQQALDSLSGSGFTRQKAQLENLPAEADSLHLVICDYTLDFMNDNQIRELNRTLPGKLNPFGVFVVTLDAPLLTWLHRLTTAVYSPRVEFRSPRKLQTLLPNLQAVYLAETSNNNYLTVFTRTDSPIQPTKEIYGLYCNEGPFEAWIGNQPPDRLPSCPYPDKHF